MTNNSLAYMNHERYCNHSNQPGMELKREMFTQSIHDAKVKVQREREISYLVFRKKPPKSIIGMISGGAKASATCKLGEMQEMK
jgi:hypothetical protein